MSTTPYVFVRTEGFYVVELGNRPGEIEANAKCNPGTIRVETIHGEVVWPKDSQPQRKDVSK